MSTSFEQGQWGAGPTWLEDLRLWRRWSSGCRCLSVAALGAGNGMVVVPKLCPVSLKHQIDSPGRVYQFHPTRVFQGPQRVGRVGLAQQVKLRVGCPAGGDSHVGTGSGEGGPMQLDFGRHRGPPWQTLAAETANSSKATGRASIWATVTPRGQGARCNVLGQRLGRWGDEANTEMDMLQASPQSWGRRAPPRRLGTMDNRMGRPDDPENQQVAGRARGSLCQGAGTITIVVGPWEGG